MAQGIASMHVQGVEAGLDSHGRVGCGIASAAMCEECAAQGQAQRQVLPQRLAVVAPQHGLCGMLRGQAAVGGVIRALREQRLGLHRVRIDLGSHAEARAQRGVEAVAHVGNARGKAVTHLG